ncbi:replication protein A 70 kDa DNA-binding subunit B-like, partial [Bidens hawaiensis]|uniref:replication protein A 70 kDa DNA-binding subunit B-like n=1 Tax=Bidens hawaiensis TaxID=980011 RepID=UPI004049090C
SVEDQKFTMFNEIDVLKTSPSTLKVRVLRMWSIKDNKNVNEDFLIEMVLMDENENRIQATVYKQNIYRFKRFLKESSTLTIVNLSVGLNGSNYRVIDCPNKLVLGPNTHVNSCQEFDGRLFGFKMISFESLINKDIFLKSTVDIIGHVVHVFKNNASNVKDKNKRTMEICDLRGNCVYLILWDHYVSELSKYVIEHFDEGHAIVILQFGRVKYYTGSDGKEKVYVSNSFGSNVSRFFINDYLFEIEEYKNSLVDLLNANDVSIRKPIPVKMLSSVDDEFLRATDFFNIGDICTIISPKSIIILGTIKAICPDTEWYYIGCNTCSRKLMENNGEGGKEYECKTVRCNVLGVIPTPRFKIKIRVQDSTGVVSLTLFDRDAKMLTKKTAKELIDSQNEVCLQVKYFFNCNSHLYKRW